MKFNVNIRISEIQRIEEFTDVTLVCDNNEQLNIYNVILYSGTPFFLNILLKSVMNEFNPLDIKSSLQIQNYFSRQNIDFLFGKKLLFILPTFQNVAIVQYFLMFREGAINTKRGGVWILWPSAARC